MFGGRQDGQAGRTDRGLSVHYSKGYQEREMVNSRRKHQLHLPYGPAAARQLFGFLDPPWKTYPEGAGRN